MDEQKYFSDPEETVEDEEQGMFEHFRLNVDVGQTPMRVDKYMACHLEDTSRHRVQCAIKEGYVRVNDKVAKANLIIRPGDVIRFVMPYRRRGLEILPQDIPLDIVYEDNDLLLVNKQAGMVVHPGHGHFEGTLVNALSYHLGISQGPEAEDERMGILVHRIDKDTSGLLVVAKNDETQLDLARQFFEHSIERKYVAVVWGNIKEDEGTIDGNIGRDPNDRLRFRVYPDDDTKGKHAVTHYRVLERFGYVTVVQAGNGQDPSDQGTHELHRSPSVQRRTVRRVRDPQRNHLCQVQAVHQELFRDMPASGPSRQDSGLRPSTYPQVDTIRLHDPEGHGVDD